MGFSFSVLVAVCAFLLSSGSECALAAAKNPRFDRVITVVLENTNYSKAMAQPFLRYLAQNGASFSQFSALIHPSQGNYVMMTSGDFNGVHDDKEYDVNAMNIVDLLEDQGLSWKVYADNYPGNCFTGMTYGAYVRKHNPFISYVNIQGNADRCSHIVNSVQFDIDAQNGQLPNYVFYVPDLKNDGHDTGVAYADRWYSQKFSRYISDSQFMNRTILITTFDESGNGPGNQIYTSIYGPDIQPGEYADPVSTPSLLRFIEDNWNLGNFGKKDTTANPLPDIWK